MGLVSFLGPALAACGAPGLAWDDSAKVSGPTVKESIGLSVHIPAGAGEAEKMERARQLGLAKATGATWLREDFTWSQIEPQKGNFVLDGYSAWLDDVTAQGFKVLAILDFGNPWASSLPATDDHAPPDDPEDFAHYAKKVAATFGDRIGMYEIWNEPNLGRFWRGNALGPFPNLSGDPPRFAELVYHAAPAIKAGRQDAIVLFGGVFFHAQATIGGDDFIDQALSARPEIATMVDAFAFHPYALYPPRAAPEDGMEGETPFSEMQAALHTTLKKHGATDRLVVTEIGWPTFYAPTYDQLDPMTQASYLVRSFFLALLFQATPWFYYTLEDGPHTDQFPPEDNFGLYAFSTGAPKPAQKALALIAERYGDFVFSRDRGKDFNFPDGAYAIELKKGTSEILTVFWRNRSVRAAGAVKLELHKNAKVTIHDALDQAIAGASIKDAIATVPVDPWPTFVHEAR